MGKYSTFTVIVPTESGEREAYKIQIIGWNADKIGNIYLAIRKLIDTAIKRGDGKYRKGKAVVERLIADALKAKIHLEVEYPAQGTFDFGTFDYTKN